MPNRARLPELILCCRNPDDVAGPLAPRSISPSGFRNVVRRDVTEDHLTCSYGPGEQVGSPSDDDAGLDDAELDLPASAGPHVPEAYGSGSVAVSRIGSTIRQACSRLSIRAKCAGL